LQGWLGPSGRIVVLDIVERHDDGLSFLKAARRTGVDATIGRTLKPGTMRRAMRAFEAAGAATTYRVALALVRA
jgi:malonyl-CoA O-methyltransferase